jgi:hypothetical protein
VPLSYIGRVCDVSPYNAEHGKCKNNVPIITGATAYTCQSSEETYIFVINDGLWFGPKLSYSLLNQNQLRCNGISVQDNPFERTTPLSIEHLELTIPLHLSGTNIFLNARTPTQHELDNCPHLHVTCDAEWNPHTVRLALTHSVEAEANIHTNTMGPDDVEPGLSQISSVYSFSAMAESLHDIYSINSKQSISVTNVDLPGHHTFISK